MASPAHQESECYKTLELDRDCSAVDIKRSFQRLVKKWHPDKVPQGASQSARDSATKKFHEISRAYDILCDDEKRSKYDAQLVVENVTQTWPLSDVVDLDDMTFDPAQECYQLPCRCGGWYVVSDDDLEAGVEVVCCSMCSLSIRVLYQDQQAKE